MPELPDVTVYVEALESRVVGKPLEALRLLNPFVLRTVFPPAASLAGRRVQAVKRLQKRIVLELEGGYFISIHLMVAGRLHWRAPHAAVGIRHALARLDFPDGALELTEAGSKRRAAIHLFGDPRALMALHRGGLEVLGADFESFWSVLRSENHTLKRVLTDPRLFSGIGNAYSDEILHSARLSPVLLTSRIQKDDAARLFEASQRVLTQWTDRLREECRGAFPEKVTAFREGMAVHGRYRKPCPVCGTPVMRISYADNETNYCPKCQTKGRVLSDRSLARLLRDDWPRSIDELEERLPVQRPR